MQHAVMHKSENEFLMIYDFKPEKLISFKKNLTYII